MKTDASGKKTVILAFCACLFTAAGLVVLACFPDESGNAIFKTRAWVVQLWLEMAAFSSAFLIVVISWRDANSPARKGGAAAPVALDASMSEMRMLRFALDAHAIVAVTDQYGVITDVNDKFCELSKYSREELLGNTHRVVNSGHHDALFFANLWRTIRSGKIWKGEVCNRAKDGGIYWVHTTIVPFLGRAEKPVQYVSIRADITSRKLAEQEVQRMAFYDFLTDLPNRRLMADRVRAAQAQAAASGRHGALMLLDLDNFKDVNDSLGHDYGDELLKQVGDRLVKCVRQADTVARMGGDEFAVVLNDLDEDLVQAGGQACDVAEAIRGSLQASYRLKDKLVQSSVSMGLVLFPEGEGGGRSDLLTSADMALYKAKAQGKNKACVFDASLQREVSRRAELQSALHQAVANREFVVYYQPIVDGNRAIHGYEALLRWTNPEPAPVLPGEFIPLLEQTGLIVDVGLWVLSEACHKLRQWSESPFCSRWTISVNISAQQIRRGDFVDRVIAIVTNAGVDPNLLLLEMTESVFHLDLDGIAAKMKALVDFGIRFSVDDFGTGYLSFGYLKDLPLHQLKIDRSFVSGLTLASNDAAIAKTILALANVLSLDVVAEGIETEGQFDFLHAHGCNVFQGFLFGRPMLLGQWFPV